VNAPTTSKRNTLAELEKDVSARRAAAPMPRVRSRSIGLGDGVLAQLEQLRGQSRKRGLFALLQAGRGTTRTPASVASARAYDVGAPIRVSGAYAGAFAASLSADDADSWTSIAYSGDDAATTAFTVEVFDPDSVAAPPAPPEPAVAIEPPVAAPLGIATPDDGVLGLDLSAVAAKDAEESDQFEREVQAILSGKTARPAPRPQGLSGAPDPQASAPPPAASSAPHQIFEEMGQNMAYATAFNLPAMELGKRFDAIEREIAVEEAAESRAPVREYSLDLTDEEITRSLAAPPAPTPAPTVAPAVAPTVTVAPVVSDPPPPAPVEAAPPPPIQADAAAPPNATTPNPAPVPADNGRSKP
jgi:hypothetical protein